MLSRKQEHEINEYERAVQIGWVNLDKNILNCRVEK